MSDFDTVRDQQKGYLIAATDFTLLLDRWIGSNAPPKQMRLEYAKFLANKNREFNNDAGLVYVRENNVVPVVREVPDIAESEEAERRINEFRRAIDPATFNPTDRIETFDTRTGRPIVHVGQTVREVSGNGSDGVQDTPDTKLPDKADTNNGGELSSFS